MLSRTKLLCTSRLREFFINRLHESTDSKANKSLNHLFIDERVQSLLKKITNIDIEKVFRPRALGDEVKAPEYKLLCTEELEEELNNARKQQDYLMQMPPVVDERKEISEVLSIDTSLDGHDIHHASYVFVDISPDFNYKDRFIVIREPNGTLRKANWDERKRMNQIYDPIPGRELYSPKMFEIENFKKVLDCEEYEFILDRTCVQFDPDEPLYHKFVTMTYEAIDSRGHFSRLHSTRHFGCLAFYLVKNKRIDNMLIDNIDSERIEDAFNLVKLYHIVHPDCESAKLGKTNEMELLREFIKLDSKKKIELELKLSDYERNLQEKESLENNIQESQGFS